MIPCHDLRIGNIILVNNCMRKVSVISGCNTRTNRSTVGVETITNGEVETFSIENIHPLLITDSILRQCNFRFHSYFKVWQLTRTGWPAAEMEIDMFNNYIDFMGRTVVKKISSLHQLQNIYYMLQGKELDFDADTALSDEAKYSGIVYN